MPKLLTNIRSNLAYLYGMAVFSPLFLGMFLPFTHIAVRGLCFIGGVLLLACVYFAHPAPRHAAVGNLIGASLLVAALIATIIALVSNGAALG